MARSITEIYNYLNAEKAGMSQLNADVVSGAGSSVQDSAEELILACKSGSKVANWRLLLFLFAVGSWVVEVLFDLHTSDIDTRLSAKRPHTLRWYAEESKQYQYGYAMVWQNDNYEYEIDDENSRIIKYAAASERCGKVVLKVAGEISGVMAPLTNQQKATFTEFWNKWRDAGVKLEIISQPADQVKVSLTIIRDRLVLDASNNLLRDPGVNPINAAIEAFSRELEFDGILRLSKLVDAIQGAEGVVDVNLTQAYIKPSGGEWQLINIYAETAAGYFILSYSDSTINYIDNVNVDIRS
jgi:hypothetical protein